MFVLVLFLAFVIISVIVTGVFIFQIFQCIFKHAFANIAPFWVSKRLFSEDSTILKHCNGEYELDLPSVFYPSLASLLSCTNNQLGSRDEVLSLCCASDVTFWL